MKAYIFDLDGTIINSYDAISDRLQRLFLKHGFSFTIEEIKEKVLTKDTKHFLQYACNQTGLILNDIEQEFKEVKENYSLISLMPNAKEMLQELQNRGDFCFIFTHRGISTKRVLNELGILSYFNEVIDMTCGFQRKPDPQAINYLIEKYHLDKNNTYYVGDRLLDVEAGLNADIQTIFYQSADVDIDYHQANIVIQDLLEII